MRDPNRRTNWKARKINHRGYAKSIWKPPPPPQKKIKERIPLPYIINYRCRDRQCAIVPSPHPPSTFQEKRFFPDWFQRFRRVSAVNFIPCSLCRGRDTDPCINEKKGRRREEYGSTWLFRARSDRSSPEFPTNSAPAARVSVGGERKGGRGIERILWNGYWYHIYRKRGFLFVRAGMLLMICPPRVTGGEIEWWILLQFLQNNILFFVGCSLNF